MNILHLRYALEIARVGSINKASENLLVAQPNLSRAIKEMEKELGIQIFDRSARGMRLTMDGEQFVRYASKITTQIDQVEQFYKQGRRRKERFAVSVPKSGYIIRAFERFVQGIPAELDVDVVLNEASAAQTVENILRLDYQLGIIRHAADRSASYKEMLEQKGLGYEYITSVIHVVLVSKQSPLAGRGQIRLDELAHCPEIVLGDPLMSALPVDDARRELPGERPYRQIKVFDRGTQHELVRSMPASYMWASPCGEDWLRRHGLVQLNCVEYQKIYNDVLIYRKNYKLTRLDQSFITELCRSKREYLNDMD